MLEKAAIFVALFEKEREKWARAITIFSSYFLVRPSSRCYVVVVVVVEIWKIIWEELK